MSNYKPKLITLVGPTASGKTNLALKLAYQFNGEIISADSRTIYQEMNIGTAKPTMEQRLKVPHYLIDIIAPDQEFTVAEFKKEALKCIDRIIKRYRIPFLVGGTGLYISSIIDNLEIPRVPPDEKLRLQLEEKINKHGLDYLWKKLVKLDPEAADFVQKQNPRRIIRALEVCLKTKKPFSKLRKKGKPLFNCLRLGIKISKNNLSENINRRINEMIKSGLVEETKNLIKKYSSPSPCLNTIGYREIVSYLKNEINFEQAVELIKKNTHQYARRQITWFKRDKQIHWIKNQKEAEKLIRNFLHIEN
ncbi:MAG: tRNA (adenosine(37)-N6)-dimethylallyltransferase MiaA [Patescibacteria group bacterium]|jgi:tRNA dimethylallyltransferase|nr:tRNA (adenosine(37)-N6)-dimethylallyltransferase MiaA [Patescibacteria group bacterium]MDD5172884.1 tRNA (adenosine(37)-N6)-dimethylallyltransferase MiaA [Patescibacteria group bacterium]